MDKSKKAIDDVFNNMVKTHVPFGGSFELTPQCNLDCKMCYVHLTKDQMGERKELTAEQWISIIDQAYEKGMTFALLTGGECLMHPDFKEIYLHLRKLGVITTVNTNGLLLNTPGWIDFFKANRPRRIQITLYGASDDTYGAVTGHRVYNRVINAINLLKEAKLDFQIAITPSAYLIKDVPEITRYCRENNILSSLNNGLIEADEDTGRSLDNYQINCDDCIEMYRELLIMSGKEPAPPRDVESLELPKRIEFDKPAHGLRCAAGRASFSITWDGTMHPCLSLRDAKAYPLRDGFKTAWDQTVRNAFDYIVPIECDNCKYFPACFNCVLSRSSKEDIGHCDPKICEIARKRVASGVFRIKE